MQERVYTQTFGVVGAIIEKDGKVLLVKEKVAEPGTWNQPAGWLGIGEDPVEAIKREVKEETGLEFEPTALLGIYSLARKDKETEPGIFPHAIKIIFRGKITGGELIRENYEIAEVNWYSPEEVENLKNLRDKDIITEVKDYFAGVEYPLEILHHRVQA